MYVCMYILILKTNENMLFSLGLHNLNKEFYKFVVALYFCVNSINICIFLTNHLTMDYLGRNTMLVE
jgi:hypothetical protein